MRLRFLTALVLTLIGMALPHVASGQTFPSKPIRFVVPFPAGSATDGVARIVGEEMRKSLGQPVIIENKPGADGIVGAQAVAQATPDGYTVLIGTNSTHGVNSTLYKELPYDAQKDFVAIGGVFHVLQMLCVKTDSPVKDVKGLIEEAKRRDKPMTFGSGNTSSHVAGALLKERAKLNLTHVPYRGGPQALAGLASGEIDIYFSDPIAAKPLVDGGQVRVLAVADKTRLHLMPNVPTMIESGFPDFEIVSSAGMFAPAKADPAVVALLNLALVAALASPDVKSKIQILGADVMSTSPQELTDYLAKALVFWGKMVELAGIEKK